MSTSFLSTPPQINLLDAVGRIRISNPVSRFAGKMIGTKKALMWAESVALGGAISYDMNLSSCLLQVPATPNAVAIRQSKRYISYPPGKSQLLDTTFVMHPVEPGLIQRVGYFDSANGLFLELNGDMPNAEIAVVRRTSVTGGPVDERIPQAAWNLDKLDGSGASKKTLNLNLIQFLVIDFVWLSAGSIRFGFYIDGEVIYCHRINNANVLSAPFMTTPSLPLRWEIRTTAPISVPATLYQICGAAISEGGVEEPGIIRSYFRTGLGVVIPSAAFRPVLAIRINPAVSTIRSTILPQNLSVGSSTAANFNWFLALNPVVVGGPAPVWTDLPESAAQFDITRTGTVDPATAVILSSGFSATQLSAIPNLDLPEALALAANVDGTIPDEMVLCARPLTGSETFSGSLAWRELN